MNELESDDVFETLPSAGFEVFSSLSLHTELRLIQTPQTHDGPLKIKRIKAAETVLVAFRYFLFSFCRLSPHESGLTSCLCGDKELGVDKRGNSSAFPGQPEEGARLAATPFWGDSYCYASEYITS